MEMIVVNLAAAVDIDIVAVDIVVVDIVVAVDGD